MCQIFVFVMRRESVIGEESIFCFPNGRRCLVRLVSRHSYRDAASAHFFLVFMFSDARDQFPGCLLQKSLGFHIGFIIRTLTIPCLINGAMSFENRVECGVALADCISKTWLMRNGPRSCGIYRHWGPFFKPIKAHRAHAQYIGGFSSSQNILQVNC